MRLFTDPLGNRVPLGRVRRELVAHFLDGSTPSWLSMSTGTASHGGDGTDRYFQGLTGTSAGNEATLQAAFGISSDQVEAIFWTVEGLRTSNMFHLWLSLDDLTPADNGVGLRQDTNSLKLHIAGDPEVVHDDVPYTFKSDRTPEGQRHNATLALFPKFGEVYLLRDDQVVYARDISSDFNHGVLTPRLRLSNSGAGSQAAHFRLGQVRLLVEHN